MKWTREEPRPAPPPADKWTVKVGHIELSVLPHSHDSSQQFGYFSLTLGKFATETAEERKRTWPREALELARQQLDEFEHALELDEVERAAATGQCYEQ